MSIYLALSCFLLIAIISAAAFVIVLGGNCIEETLRAIDARDKNPK